MGSLYASRGKKQADGMSPRKKKEPSSLMNRRITPSPGKGATNGNGGSLYYLAKKKETKESVH